MDDAPPSSPDAPTDTAAWHALVSAALVARPEVTAAVDAAVSKALQDHVATQPEACIGLAHALAARASRTGDPAAMPGAVHHLASMLVGGPRPASGGR